ncbi:hypothetical protein BDZ91DRAFT_739338 [Kalaharituber pfeilii]|nr:hypothetical protein BDZ91DRAFT_739338 [Kalaharituber pfeilii]
MDWAFVYDSRTRHMCCNSPVSNIHIRSTAIQNRNRIAWIRPVDETTADQARDRIALSNVCSLLQF